MSRSLPVVGVAPAAIARLSVARWQGARWLMLLAAGLLVGALILVPASAMSVLWYVVVPLLPAVFLVNPMLWRSVCPLATLNELGNSLGRQRALSPRVSLALSAAGALLFHLLVPARHFLFNRQGPALAIVVAIIGALAVVLGAIYAVRSAFCNALCPMLPLELLYGSAPVVEMPRGRCAVCTVCTPRGCIDLAKQKAIVQRLGPTRRTTRWLLTPHGMFAAALPGFIFGYYQVGDGALGTAGIVYASTLQWSLVSLFVVAGVARICRVSAQRLLPCVAAASGAVYYWYTIPVVITRLTKVTWPVAGVRVLGMALLSCWLLRALARTPRGVSGTRWPSPWPTA